MKKFPQKRGPLSIFPAPDPGETVEINPPSLQWVAEPGVTAYRVTVENAAGERVADADARHNYFRFRRLLPPGEYRWNVFVGDAEFGERRFTVPENARPFLVPAAADVLAALPARHPRHIHVPEDLAAAREKFAPELEIIRRNVELALASPLMAYPDFYKSDGRGDYRSMLDEIRVFLDRDTVACALAYLFLDDAAAGRRAHDAVLRVCEWNPSGPCSVRGWRGDEIGLSIVRTLPAILDWTWDLYTGPELEWVCGTLARHGADVYRRMVDEDFLGRPGDSHVGRLPGYLGEIALVLADVLPRETALEYLDYALEIYGSIFPHYGGRDGGWAEGVFYGSSYTKWYLPFFFAIERLTGFSFLTKPFYRNLSQFFLHFAPPGQEAHPFGDGNWPTAAEWPGFQAQNPFGVYAERFGPEEARAFSRTLNKEIDIYHLHLLDVIRPEPRVRDEAAAGPARNSYLSPDTGMISMRRCVAEPARDVAVLARCSRYGSPSHQHADQGNFAVLAGGKALLAPSGTFGYRFGEDHHREWTVQTVAHNCILIDGVGQRKNSAEAVGVILEFTGSVAKFDLTAAYPMLTRYLRTLEFDRERLIVRVIDELEAPHPVVVDFRLHSYARPEGGGDRVRLSRPPGAAEIRVAGQAEYTCCDHYCYGDLTSAPGPRRGVEQYHMNWRFPAAAKHRIETDIQVSLDA